MVMFSSAGRKDSLRNIEATGEFTCSLATMALREAMNLSSAPLAPGVDEFGAAGLATAPSACA
jgi:flavin reductase (DIM6/NTAB) family NADH-FMN oxidoreductase RutF